MGWTNNCGQPNNLSMQLPQPCFESSIGVRGGYPYVQYEKDTHVPTGYFWHYGDPITLEFDIEGELVDDAAAAYSTIEEYAAAFPKLLTIVDFRGRTIIEQTLRASEKISYTFTQQQSLLLGPGSYRLSLHLLLHNGTRLTLIGQDECNITVL